MEDKNKTLISAIKSIKMQDAGEKRKSYDDECSPCVSGYDNKVRYPSMYFNTVQVPAIKGHSVDDEVTLVIKGKIVNHSLNEDIKNSTENYDISIKEVGILDK